MRCKMRDISRANGEIACIFKTVSSFVLSIQSIRGVPRRSTSPVTPQIMMIPIAMAK